MSLRAALDGLAGDGGAFAIEAPEGWTQGRTLYGGMTAALCAEAARRSLADLPPLRSAQFAFTGAAAGRLRFEVGLIRQGRSSSFVAVDGFADAGPVARALFAYGAARESQVGHDAADAPRVAAPEDCPPFFEAPRGGFFQNFEMRLAAGARPMSPGAEPAFTVWVRHLDHAGVDPVVSLLALADSLPPAAMVAFPAPAPISTVTWSLDILQPVQAGEWRLLSSASEQAADGYSLQAMSLWSREGRRLAAGRQTVAIFA
ncbi:acyl-CoA thioesterase [Phenylobacterium terrae]|uniref:Acyl-CoA thioesterase n=1 Tax=Phenylobacterium terrae TaxID=2665495 RepID=A0ABW4MY29_9CAUL